MTEEIIIDGVNVAGCEFAVKPKNDNRIKCHCAKGLLQIAKMQEQPESIKSGLCENNPYCYYKQLKRLEQENRWQRDEEKYLKECCIKAGKELEKHSFKWDGKEKNLVVQALQLNQLYEKLEQERDELKFENDRYKQLLKGCPTEDEDCGLCVIDEQNKRLKQENKELKNEINELGKKHEDYCNTMYWQMKEQMDKYRSALDTIQRMVLSAWEQGKYLDGGLYNDLINEFNKINEGLSNDRN